MTAKASSPTSSRRDQHGVAQAQRLALPHVREVDQVRDLADLREHLVLAARFEERLELHRDVEVILDRVLAAAGDQQDVVDARGQRLLHAVLDDGLVHQRQHLFGLRLGGRQKPGAKSCGRKNGFSNTRQRGLHAMRRNLVIRNPQSQCVSIRSCRHARPSFPSRPPRPRPCRARRTAAPTPTRFSAPLAPLDERRRALILEVETLKREQNAAAEEVARRKKAGEDIARWWTPTAPAGSR